MAMDVSTFRKLVALDPNDPLNRFGLGKKLLEQEHSPAALAEAAEHLRFANGRAPEHLATYHLLGQVLIKLGQTEEAKRVLQAGCERSARRAWGGIWGRRWLDYSHLSDAAVIFGP